MKAMKELRALPDVEVRSRLTEINKELLKLRTQLASGANAGGAGKFRQLKRNRARIFTLQPQQTAEREETQRGENPGGVQA